MTKFSVREEWYQAFRLLQIVFIVAPIVAGLDKFFYFLTDWSAYISPEASQLVQGKFRTALMAVGVIEIIVGVGMIFRPKIFSYIVAIWLLLIIVNLLLTGRYYDIALRDLGLLLGALALGRLSKKYEDEKLVGKRA